MTQEAFADKRLLGALDYIDERFIAEVTESYTFEAPGEYKPNKRAHHRAYRQFVAMAACLILLTSAFPVVGKYLAGKGVNLGGWGGNAGAGTSELEMPTPTETQAINTEPEMTQVLETYPSETQAEVIDSGFDKALERYADMSADEIYADVLKGGWVVIGEDNSDFAAGKELWFDFFDKSQKGEPAYALIADYARINDPKSEIVLYEIIFDGDLFYYKRMYNNQIVSDEYKYLIHGIATKSTMRFADEAYFLTNYEFMTLDDFNENMLSSSTTFPRPVAVIRFKK